MAAGAPLAGGAVPGIGQASMDSATHLGFQLDSGNYFKLVGSDPQVRVGERNQNAQITYLRSIQGAIQPFVVNITQFVY